MRTRRRFTAEFKAQVALEALRGDRTIQEIAAKHQVHPNQVSAWKRQAVDGLGEVFSTGSEQAARWLPSLAMQPIGDLIEGTESFNKSAVPYRYPIKQAILEFVLLNKRSNGELAVQMFFGRMKFGVECMR